MDRTLPTPLEGIRVIDFTSAWAGPMCTRMLADMGAEVIKIENPTRLDLGRTWPPFAEGQQGSSPNRSGWFAIFNRGKKDCLMNLKEPDGIEIVKQIVRISDIVVENFPPRVMTSLGLDYQTLKQVKPDLIMISLSGYGATGPDKDRPAWGAVLEPYAGLSLLIADADGCPNSCGIQISDHTGALSAAFATLAALYHRDLTGEGQHIDVSEVEALIACMPKAILEFTITGRMPKPKANKDDTKSPHGCYRCHGEDEWVAISIESDREWYDFCLVMGKPNLAKDKRFLNVVGRLQNQDELDKIVTEWTCVRNHTDIMRQLQDVGIACGPVYNTEELYNDPQLRSRGFFVETSHPEVGNREVPGLFAKLSRTPGAINDPDPLLGEHTDWVLHHLLPRNVT
jgi:crotonobetainyl-CoA:carnitine CoA-transferase CaiB-like acyl-CoA transferase